MKKAIIVIVVIILIAAVVLFGFLFFKKSTIEFSNSANKENLNNLSNTTGFNLNNVKWEEIKPEGNYWSGRDSQAVVIFKNKLWLSGGVQGGKVTPPPIYETIVHPSDLWVTSDLKKWELVTDKVPWGQRRSMAIVEYRGKLWLMGGWDKKYGETKNDIWTSDNGTDWKLFTASAPWAPREGHTLLIYKDKMWIFGGVDYYNHQKRFNDVWYSENGKDWTEATANAPWSPRYDHTVVVYKDKLWLIGGMTTGNSIYKDVWVSEDGANWTLVTDSPPWLPRHGHFSTDYKGLLWIIGGWCEEKDKGLNDTWVSEDGKNWTEVKIKAPWPGREDLTGIIWNDKIVIIGGMADLGKQWEWKNDIWELNY